MKYYKYIIALILLLSCGFSQGNSSITIKGTGTGSTSAHYTITTNAYLCPDEYIVQNGATLTTWGSMRLVVGVRMAAFTQPACVVNYK